MTFDILSFVLGAVACMGAQWIYAACGVTRFYLVVTGRRRLANLLTNIALAALLVTVVAWVAYEMWSALRLIAINVRGR